MALVASTTLLLLFTFAVCINGEKYFLHGRFWNGFLTNIKRQDFLSRDRDFPDLWFDQVLDHTNSSLGTWKQVNFCFIFLGFVESLFDLSIYMIKHDHINNTFSIL